MLQDKGRGVVILDRSLYVEKANLLLNSDKFKILQDNPTATLEGQVQRAVRGIKKQMSSEEYWRLYHRRSKPAKFYGTAKVHKIKEADGPEKLPLRPIVSNIGTATYNLFRYLAQLLSPLATM